MAYDAFPTIYRIYSENWADFHLKKAKKTWVRETSDKILLFVQIQGSKWGKMYYLNFGAHFLEIDPIDKALSNLPKVSDWHVVGRYEDFQEITTDEYNELFSLEEKDSGSLEKRCGDIAIFSGRKIIPKLETIGNISISGSLVCEGRSEEIFFPLRAQSIAQKDILQYIGDKYKIRKSK